MAQFNMLSVESQPSHLQKGKQNTQSPLQHTELFQGATEILQRE